MCAGILYNLWVVNRGVLTDITTKTAQIRTKQKKNIQNRTEQNKQTNKQGSNNAIHLHRNVWFPLEAVYKGCDNVSIAILHLPIVTYEASELSDSRRQFRRQSPI